MRWTAYIQLHPTSSNVAYAYYLRGLSYYEQIADIQRDQKGTEQAMTAMQEVVNRFPDSAYARDARLKIDLCRDQPGRQGDGDRALVRGPEALCRAINRFQRVIEDYQTTNHTPEALYRLTEVYLILGMTDQAKRTAAVLGYNYPGSPWYTDGYRALAKDGMAPPLRTTDANDGNFFSRTLGSLF